MNKKSAGNAHNDKVKSFNKVHLSKYMTTILRPCLKCPVFILNPLHVTQNKMHVGPGMKELD